MSTPPLASGHEGPHALRPLLDTVLEALDTGARARGGPLPAGGPEAVAARTRKAVGDVLPDRGDPHAVRTLVHAFAETAADPAPALRRRLADHLDDLARALRVRETQGD